ncbi:unnamed protein product [Bursaphelenchus okinawaensis]|uniref:Uncharacterized protein n=1 Tax=Bursaphelenchus okinawaensis TaxID=465554 RepID=A0A811L599_9BILA|nr:unnamed protein product [Bursaphelenchus okinawaensis]CAG9116915.1 unnamed protein product [Bursaphelenchus okinawaensis]
MGTLFKQCHDGLQTRYHNLRNEIRTVTWFVHTTILTFIFGLLFICIGLVFVRVQDETAIGWSLVSAGSLAILLGIFLLIVRCVIPSKPQRQQRRRRRTRARVWTSRASERVWNGRTVDLFAGPVVSPPSYDEARADRPPAYSEHLSARI